MEVLSQKREPAVFLRFQERRIVQPIRHALNPDHLNFISIDSVERIKTDEYLGFSLTGNDKGDIFACAPRHQRHLNCAKSSQKGKQSCKLSDKPANSTLMAGRCLVRRSQKPDNITEVTVV